MADKKLTLEEKKELTTEELENVTGGALAGLSVSPVTSGISFTAPASPFANSNPEVVANSTIVKDKNGIEIPVFNGGAITIK